MHGLTTTRALPTGELLELRLSSPSLRILHLGWCTHLQTLSLECTALTALFAYGCTRLSAPSLRCAVLGTEGRARRVEQQQQQQQGTED